MFWSTLEPDEIVEISFFRETMQIQGSSEVIRCDSKLPDTVHFCDVEVHGRGNTEIIEHRILSGDEINNSNEPWVNKVRYVDPQQTNK